LGLNPIRVNPTSTASTRRAPRHHAHHGPAHHTERGRSHIQILINPDDAIIVIFSDGQQSSRKAASNPAGAVVLALSLIVWCAPGASLHVSPA
jgi:hypothetical protein